MLLHVIPLHVSLRVRGRPIIRYNRIVFCSRSSSENIIPRIKAETFSIIVIELMQRMPLGDLLPRRQRHLEPVFSSLTVVRASRGSDDAGPDHRVCAHQLAARVQHAHLAQT